MEVKADQLDAGVRDRGHERVRVGVGVGGHHLLEGPPELDRVEPGRPRRGRPGEHRKLGEQDRAVNVEPQPMSAHQVSFSRGTPANQPVTSAVSNNGQPRVGGDPTQKADLSGYRRQTDMAGPNGWPRAEHE